jgi:hypothetical protein
MDLIQTDTFAFQTDGPAVAGQSAAAAQQEMGTIGSGVQDRTQAPNVAGPADSSVFFKLAGKMLEPLVKREQEAQFYEGMSRAAAGEAAKDIAEGRTVVSAMFGPNNVELGARAYEAEADAANLMGKVYEALPTLSQMPTQQASQEIRKLVELHRPKDDPLRATMYEAAAVKEVPGILRAQAKKYAEFMQDRANTAHATRTLGLLDNYEAKIKAATSDDERALAVNSLLEAVDVMPGQDPARAMDNVGTSLIALVRQGKFESAKFFREQGLLKALDPKMAAMVENTIDIEATQRAPLAMNDAELLKLLQIRGDYRMPSDAKIAALDSFNEEVRARTGIPADAFPRQYYMGQLERDKSTLEQQQAAAAREQKTYNAAAAKAHQQFLDNQKEVTEALVVVQQVLKPAEGDTGPLVSLPTQLRNLPSDAARRIVTQSLDKAWSEASVPQRTVLLNRAPSHYDAIVKDSLKQMVHPDSVPNDVTAGVVASLMNVPGWDSRFGISAAQVAMVETYKTALAQNPQDTKGAWEVAKQVYRSKEAVEGTSEALREQVTEAVASKLDPFLGRTVLDRGRESSAPDASPASQGLFAEMVLKQLKTQGGNDDEARIDTAIELVRKQFDDLGELVVLRTQGANAGLQDWMTRNSKDVSLSSTVSIGTALKVAFQKRSPEPVSEWVFIRAADGKNPGEDPHPVFHAFHLAKGKRITITGFDLLPPKRTAMDEVQNAAQDLSQFVPQ